MNIVHLHLLLNHLPVMGSVFGTLLLAVGPGAVSSRFSPVRPGEVEREH